jgi:hypothetical protein
MIIRDLFFESGSTEDYNNVIDTNVVFHTLGIISRHNVPVQYKMNTESNAYF